MQLGSFPVTEDFDVTRFYHSTTRQGSSRYSYLYSSEGRNRYAFDDPEMGKFSHIPAIIINGKTASFTINKDRVVHYGDEFFYSLPDLLKKIQLPQELDQDLLDKIAIIANYLAQGEESEYEMGTAQQKDKDLLFLVKNGTHCCKVKLPSFTDDGTIIYETVMSRGSFTTNESLSSFDPSTTSSNSLLRASRSTSDGKASQSTNDEIYSRSTDSEDKYF